MPVIIDTIGGQPDVVPVRGAGYDGKTGDTPVQDTV